MIAGQVSIPKFYRYLNVLSLDVVAGSMICSLYIAKVLNVKMPVPTLLALGLTVWVIYTFDHLLDSRNSPAAMSERHAFHKKHFQRLSIYLGLALACIAVLLFFMPSTTVLWGAALGCGVLAYFLTIGLIRAKSIVYKELMIAVIYACGLFIGPLSVYDSPISWQHAVVFLQFVILALLNLLIFSLYDREFDERASFPSLVLGFGESRSRLLVKTLFFLEAGLVAGSMFMEVKGQFVFLGMVLLLFLIYILQENRFISSIYRWIGDGAFLVPVIYLV